MLRATGAAGLLGATGVTLSGAAAQEQAEMRTYSYSLQEGDVFRVGLRPHDPAGNPATETVLGACLGGEADEQFQSFIVEAYRDEEFIGYRILLAPVERLAPEVLEATAATETTVVETEAETTGAALQDETTEEETPTDDEDEAETTDGEDKAVETETEDEDTG